MQIELRRHRAKKMAINFQQLLFFAEKKNNFPPNEKNIEFEKILS
jgi:hypothetical protein